jgi:hypothetical protein
MERGERKKIDEEGSPTVQFVGKGKAVDDGAPPDE